LGLAPAGWRNLLEYLRSIGFSEKEMLLAGLIKGKGEDNRFYDIFRYRIMFPIFDSVGRVIAFSGRTLDLSGNEAKYINSPETPIFKKAEVLYGFHLAKFGIRKMDFAMIVEGQMDLLMSHQGGFINTVATSGTALSEEHLKKIRRITDNLVVAFDLDKAGIQATKRALDLVLKFGFNVKIVNLMNSKDPADLAKENLSDFKKAIRESEDAVSFFWRVSKIEEIEKDKRYKIFKKEILPLLARLDNFAERSRLISKHKMSLVLGIREDFLWEEIKKMENILRDEEKGNLHNGETVSVKKDYKSTNTPLNIAITKLAGYLQRWNNKEDSLILNAQQKIQNTIGIEEFNRRLEMDKNELSRAVMEVELLGDDKILLEKYLKDLLYNFEMEWLKEQMTLCLNELSLAEKMENRSRVDEMLKKCQNVSSRINQLTKEKEL
jgi:DNA primase